MLLANRTRTILKSILTVGILLITMLLLSSCMLSGGPLKGILNSNTAPDKALEHPAATFDTSLVGPGSSLEPDKVWIDSSNTSWSGEHRCDTLHISSGADDYPDEVMEVMSYQDYKDTMNDLQSTTTPFMLKSNDYTDQNCNYLVVIDTFPFAAYADMKVHDCCVEDGKIILYAGSHSGGSVADGFTTVAVIPTNLPVGTQIEYRQVLTQDEYDKSVYRSSRWIADKPIIYLYPEQEQEVSVVLSTPEALTCSYPAYNDGWNVIANPDGSLKDINSDRDLYALYYEAVANKPLDFEDGFVVHGKDSAAFLEEKLATLGLTEREAEEFIVYWLPKLEANEYNFIHFMTDDEIDEQMGLEINPKPDCVIRVWMAFSKLDEPVDVKEPILPSPEREGFIAVEWGGIEMR